MGDILTYIFPTDANLALAAVCMPISESPSFRKEPLKQLYSHLDSLHLLAPRLRKAEVTAEVRAAGLATESTNNSEIFSENSAFGTLSTSSLGSFLLQLAQLTEGHYIMPTDRKYDVIQAKIK